MTMMMKKMEVVEVMRIARRNDQLVLLDLECIEQKHFFDIAS